MLRDVAELEQEEELGRVGLRWASLLSLRFHFLLISPGGGGSPSCAALAAAGASAGLAALLAALHWGGQAAPGLAAEL